MNSPRVIICSSGSRLIKLSDVLQLQDVAKEHYEDAFDIGIEALTKAVAEYVVADAEISSKMLVSNACVRVKPHLDFIEVERRLDEALLKPVVNCTLRIRPPIRHLTVKVNIGGNNE